MTKIKEQRANKMIVKVYSDRETMGKESAKEAIEYLKNLLDNKEEVNVIFAAAPSQLEFLSELMSEKSIDWSRVNAMHLDEYIGLEKGSNKLFSKFLNENIFNKVSFNNVYIMDFIEGKVQDEILRYNKILKDNPIDIAFIGIGENGHIAFNDPGVADFNDPLLIKEVVLDQKCKQQQVNDGNFKKIEDVPETAVTVTVPYIMSAERIFCIVPGPTKAKAINETINGEIDESCPATILREHKNTTLYLDKDSAKQIL